MACVEVFVERLAHGAVFFIINLGRYLAEGAEHTAAGLTLLALLEEIPLRTAAFHLLVDHMAHPVAVVGG